MIEKENKVFSDGSKDIKEGILQDLIEKGNKNLNTFIEKGKTLEYIKKVRKCKSVFFQTSSFALEQIFEKNHLKKKNNLSIRSKEIEHIN